MVSTITFTTATRPGLHYCYFVAHVMGATENSRRGISVSSLSKLNTVLLSSTRAIGLMIADADVASKDTRHATIVGALGAGY